MLELHIRGNSPEEVIAVFACSDFVLVHLVALTHSAVQACSWIEECSVPGCAQSCILNRRTMENAQTLKFRQYGEGAWQMCPELAFWVNMTRPGEQRQGGSRKLREVSTTSLGSLDLQCSVAHAPEGTRQCNSS